MTDQEVLPAGSDLTLDQHDLLARCEAKIEGAWQDMCDALKTIHDQELYRVAYDNFTDYCRERWGWGKSQAYRRLKFAEQRAELSRKMQDVALPSNERQARALASLAADKQPEAWREAVETAPRNPDGEPVVTSSHVTRVVERYQPAQIEKRTREPSQEELDLRLIRKSLEALMELPYSGSDAFHKFGIEALGDKAVKGLEWAREFHGEMLGRYPVRIPLADGGYFHPSEEDVQIWQEAYPGIDIEEGLRKIAAWNHSNPSKRKSTKGIRRHIDYMLRNYERDSRGQSQQTTEYTERVGEIMR